MPKRDDPNFDKLYKVKPFLEKVKDNFQKHYKLHRNIAVDESMIKFKGRSSLKQFMPKKPVKRGYKVWSLADSEGYLYNFDIYTGKTKDYVEHLLKLLPKNMLDDRKMVQGQFDFRVSNDGITYIKWKDKRVVHLLLNYSNPRSNTTVNRKQKDGTTIPIPCPLALVDYNKNMNFVDRFDQMKSCYD
nr:unnamed protein product [Callosobruchus chinensis]